MERESLVGKEREADMPETNPGAAGDEDSRERYVNLYVMGLGLVNRCLVVVVVTVTVTANRGKDPRRCARWKEDLA